MEIMGKVRAKIDRIIFFFSVIVFGLSKLEAGEVQPTDYQLYVQEIVKPYAKEIEQEFDLVCIGNGGRMPRDVEEIEVLFVAYRRATIEQARELEVRATEKLLHAINSHEKIRPYLREHPFKANRVKVCVSFRKGDDSYYSDGSVAYMSIIRGNILYRADNPSSEKYIYLLSEPYEEAVKLVQNPLLKKQSPPLN